MISNSVLMIMNSRDIPECIRPLRRLQIDKVWFRGYTEKELEPLIKKFIEDTNYANYIIVSDDVIVTDYALDQIVIHNDHFPIITGWCNLMPNIDRAAISLNYITTDHDIYHSAMRHIPSFLVKPLLFLCWNISPFTNLYKHLVNESFPSIDQIWKQEADIFETHFVNWALTSMPRHIWLKYGFSAKFRNGSVAGSDVEMSLALQADKMKMYCAREAFVYHLATHRDFIIGKVKPQVIYDLAPGIDYTNA